MDLGRLVLRQACRKGAEWVKAGCEPFRIAVNLSARQFHDGAIVETVRANLEESGLPAHRLELEITESAVMVNVEEAIGIMQGLRDLGVSLAIDDFGTGYSSLSYLKRFPINTLKIDKSFVQDLHKGRDDAAIVDAIISLAGSLELDVVAEGIENGGQLAFLIQRGCKEGQGYLLGKPMSAAAFGRLCMASR
jgi:EAL domain-containing protein (putative c-di-GMP-specific phosphodiesterase class I)